MVVDTMKALGVPESEIKETGDFGSSDLGNVGHAYPTVNLCFKIAPEGTAAIRMRCEKRPARKKAGRPRSLPQRPLL